MTWALAYGAIGLLSLLVLGLLLLRVWRSIKALGRQVALAGEQMAEVNDQIATVQQTRDRLDGVDEPARRPAVADRSRARHR